MKFLQKRWVSVVLCIAMIAVAIGIGINRDRQEEYRPQSESAAESWGEENYASYASFIYDEAAALTEQTERQISEYNASFDYSYGSICGVAVLDGLNGHSMEDAAYDMASQLALGESDCIILLDTDTDDWYFLYGEDFSYYVNNELELIFRGVFRDTHEDLNQALPELYEELSDWYADAMPVMSVDTYESENSALGSGLFFIVLLVIIVVAVVFSSIFRAGRRVVGGWGPVFFVGRRRPFYHHHPHPGPDPMHNPGPRPGSGPRTNSGARPTQNRSAGRSGGFGGSSRGSGFGGRSGGFGGGSRGGGFGGKR